MRTITVNGTGRLSVKPDTISITLTLESTEKSYDTALESAAKKLNALKKSLSSADFDEEDVKTSDLSVNTEYEYEFSDNGRRKEKFKGYKCRQVLNIRFPVDTVRLGKALSAASESGSKPMIAVSFICDDTEKLSGELLAEAARDARRKAEVLCAASGVTLGKLVSIKCGQDAVIPCSTTNFSMERDCLGSAKNVCTSLEIVPENITLTDNAVLEWEIE